MPATPGPAVPETKFGPHRPGVTTVVDELPLGGSVTCSFTPKGPLSCRFASQEFSSLGEVFRAHVPWMCPGDDRRLAPHGMAWRTGAAPKLTRTLVHESPEAAAVSKRNSHATKAARREQRQVSQPVPAVTHEPRYHFLAGRTATPVYGLQAVTPPSASPSRFTASPTTCTPQRPPSCTRR